MIISHVYGSYMFLFFEKKICDLHDLQMSHFFKKISHINLGWIRQLSVKKKTTYVYVLFAYDCQLKQPLLKTEGEKNPGIYLKNYTSSCFCCRHEKFRPSLYKFISNFFFCFYAWLLEEQMTFRNFFFVGYLMVKSLQIICDEISCMYVDSVPWLLYKLVDNR
jgi:hypothetical protein